MAGLIKKLKEKSKEPTWAVFFVILGMVFICSMLVASRDTGSFYRSLTDAEKANVAGIGKFIGELSSAVAVISDLSDKIPPFSAVLNIFYYFGVGFIAFFLFAKIINLILSTAPFLPSKSAPSGTFYIQPIVRLPVKDTMGRFILDTYFPFFEKLQDFKVVLWFGIGLGIAASIPVLGWIITLPLGLITWVLSFVSVAMVSYIALITILIIFVASSLEVKSFGAFIGRLGLAALAFAIFIGIDKGLTGLSIVFKSLWSGALTFLADFIIRVGIVFVIFLILGIIPLLLLYLLMAVTKVLEVKQDIKAATGAGKKAEEQRKARESITSGLDIIRGVGEGAQKYKSP